MKNLSRLVLACSAAFAIAAPACAGVIVDTGAGQVPYSAGEGTALQGDQWMAGAFTLSGRETITAINGWINGNAGTLRLAVLGTQGGLPSTTLFATDIKASAWFTGAWVGASGLDWTLDAGTYFAAFEVPTGYTFSGGMFYGVPSPTGNAAFTDELNNWHLAPSPIGYQVFGEPVASQDPANVPEPSSVALSGVALAALAFARKRAGNPGA